jgi:hypothetical protein
MENKIIIAGLNQQEWEIYFIHSLVESLSLKIIFWEVGKNNISLAKKYYQPLVLLKIRVIN